MEPFPPAWEDQHPPQDDGSEAWPRDGEASSEEAEQPRDALKSLLRERTDSDPSVLLKFSDALPPEYLTRGIGGRGIGRRDIGRARQDEIAHHSHLDDKRAAVRAPRRERLNPAALRDNAHVANIRRYQGSTAYWIPVRDLVDRYTTLLGSDVEERRQVLSDLADAIEYWRANQRKNWYFSALDESKEAALKGLEILMGREEDDLRGPGQSGSTPSRIATPASSLPVAVNETSQGTGSFRGALEMTPGNDELTLGRTVMGRDVAPLREPSHCIASIDTDGILSTFDGRHPIDSGGEEIRYVLVQASPSPVLYVSQCYREADLDDIDEGGLDYPILSSHAQIEGDVIGAGDMIVAAGRITSISNKSGTFQPRGAHLAATLKFMVRIRLLSETEIVQGAVTVRQWISQQKGPDVDNGQIMTLLGAAMDGRLIRS